ncbi:MAG: hypothetical protein OSB59_02570 [Candidatus Poseidoniia archaeon]|nr:hypothetical protein [Candidatus Poseidoniia archaeon]
MGGYRSGNDDKEKIRNPDRPFEDMEGNWIGLGYRGTKPNPKKRGDYPEGGSSGSRTFSPKGIETGELEKLEKKCRDGDEEACAELCKLEKDNEDFLEHLMAIADHDEYPPKLKEPRGNV